MKDNIILITVDSLRLDRVGYASGRGLTPNIDKLSRDGISFSNAFTTGPATPFSFPSLFVLDHHPFRDYTMKRTESLLTQSLRDMGYYTAGFIAYNFYISSYYGYDRGFVHFKDYFEPSEKGAFGSDGEGGKSQMVFLGKARKLLHRYLPELPQTLIGYYLKDLLIPGHRDIASSRSGNVLTEDIIHHLKDISSKPFFLWAHYMDVHSPYIPPRGFSDYPSLRILLTDRYLREVTAGKRSLTAQLASRAKILYNQEVRYVDYCIGRLISYLKQNKLYDDTTIILTSDHGEMFWEHGRLSHPTELYDELLRVPLILKSSKVPSDTVADYLVNLGQIPSTLHHLASGDEPRDINPSLISTIEQGKGLDFICAKAKHYGKRKYRLDPTNIGNVLKALPYNIFSLRTKRFKLIYDDENQDYEFYDLVRDRSEKKNIFHIKSDKASEMTKLMEILIEKYRTRSEKKGIKLALQRKGLTD